MSSLGDYFVGSADTTIGLWEGDQCSRRFLGHEQAVRAICMLGSEFLSIGDFVSVGNDGLMKVWKLDGRCVLSIPAHDSFIYSVVCINNQIITGGELGLLKIWALQNNSLVCTQTLGVPATSIWSLAEIPNSNAIMCACSDGRLYAFSNREDFPRSLEEHLRSYERRLVECNKNYLKTLELCGSDRLDSPGMPRIKSLIQLREPPGTFDRRQSRI